MNGMMGIKIFAGRSGRVFALKMCDYLNTQLGDSETIIFSDGNIFVRINEPIRDKDVFILQPIGMDPNNELVELVFWIDAFKRSSANSITAIIPYFGYAKGDKKDEPRVSIRARVVADMIETAGVDRVITMDLHSAQVQGFFKKPVDHLYASPLLTEYVRRYCYHEDLIVVSPDAGFAKRARQYADRLNCDVAIADKVRTGHDENAQIMKIIGDVAGHDCLIVDDFSISGGTVAHVAEALKREGARHIYCALSHIILHEEGVRKIQESPIEVLVTTDTVACPATRGCDKIQLVSAAPFFAETCRLIHEKRPVSYMFDHIPEAVFHSSFSRQLKFPMG